MPNDSCASSFLTVDMERKFLFTPACIPAGMHYVRNDNTMFRVDGPCRYGAQASLRTAPPYLRGMMPDAIPDSPIRWLDRTDKERAGSLFDLFAALATGDAMSLPALRPHQREPFHAFAVQVGAAALIAAEAASIPDTLEQWRSLLLALTPDWPGGEAWSLIVPEWDRPALLQPPVLRAADQGDYRTTLATPDALDMLVTSRNHDVKSGRMEGAADEDWFFALLTLQTTEGYLGAGNFGISRMNGGFGSRMVLGLRPQDGMASAWRRDVTRLLDEARAKPGHHAGLALLWLPPWDGTLQLDFTSLHPLYVDVCRRIRLRRTPHGGIEALAAGSKVARVAAAALKGQTGDPWAPVKRDGSASVTPGASGFGYRQLTRLLQAKETVRPLLALSAATDPANGMAMVAAALVRGQGKTEGLHRRVVPFSRAVFSKLKGDVFLDRMGEVAGERMDDAGAVGSRLRQALFALYQGGPQTVRRDDEASKKKAASAMSSFDREVDLVFFDKAFWDEVLHEAKAPRRTWRTCLRDIASTVFEQAAEAAPRTAERRIHDRAIARNMLDGLLHRFIEDTADGA